MTNEMSIPSLSFLLIGQHKGIEPASQPSFNCLINFDQV